MNVTCGAPLPPADLVMTMTIMDAQTESSDEWREGVEVLFFARTREMLPNVRRPGDIIRLHRMQVRQSPPYPPASECFIDWLHSCSPMFLPRNGYHNMHNSRD